MATSAKRSGSQRFAGPYSAPGQRPILALAPFAFARGKNILTGEGSAGAPSSSAIWRKRRTWCSTGPFLGRSVIIWFKSHARLWPRYPIRRGTPAHHISKAARNEFGNRIATSKAFRLRINFTAAKSERLVRPMTTSTSGTSFQTAAIFSGARIVMCASGRPALIARTAGMLIMLSPSQFEPRIRMRNGFSSLAGVSGGT